MSFQSLKKLQEQSSEYLMWLEFGGSDAVYLRLSEIGLEILLKHRECW